MPFASLWYVRAALGSAWWITCNTATQQIAALDMQVSSWFAATVAAHTTATRSAVGEMDLLLVESTNMCHTCAHLLVLHRLIGCTALLAVHCNVPHCLQYTFLLLYHVYRFHNQTYHVAGRMDHWSGCLGDESSHGPLICGRVGHVMSQSCGSRVSMATACCADLADVLYTDDLAYYVRLSLPSGACVVAEVVTKS